MIYLFTGTDVEKARQKAFQWVAAARAKAPDVAYVRLNADEITTATLDESAGTQGLFFLKSLVLLDDPFARAETAELVLKALPQLQESENAIAILAPKLLAARTKKVEAAAAKVFSFDAPKKAERGFNSALVNALAARDGKMLWKEIQKSYRMGDAPEMVHGLLHWKARDMMQKGGRGWSTQEARVLSRELIELLSDSRKSGLPLGESLERWALSLK
ncbi:MAG TPA: hypothetical protein VEA92_00430 [Candidatus Paceibacterota bacterium]|nr:hypothetical protein [Candidatus Paceibacterota bacterium]